MGETPVAVDPAALRAELRRVLDVLTHREEVLAADRARLARFEAGHLDRVGRLFSTLDGLTARLGARGAGDDPAPQAGAAGDRRGSGADGASRPRPDGDRAGSGADGASRPRHDGDLRRLFRRAARTLHPDLALDPDERARRTGFMVRANAAYAAGDRAALQRVLDAFARGGGAAAPVTAGVDRLLRLVLQLRVRLVAVEAELAALHATGAWRLMEDAEAAAARGVDVLAGVEESVAGDIAAAEAALRSVDHA